MWVMALYDAPVTTVEGRRAYTFFRQLLLKNNFNSPSIFATVRRSLPQTPSSTVWFQASPKVPMCPFIFSPTNNTA